MYCSQLLMLDDILKKEEIIKYQNFLASLTPNTSKLITVSKVKSALDITEQMAAIALMRCADIGIMNLSYGLRCPDCGMVLKKIDDYNNLESIIINCYKCEEDFSPTQDDIVVFFELIIEVLPFNMGQQEKIVDFNVENIQVAPCDLLTAIKEYCNLTVEEIKSAKDKDEKKSKVNYLLKKNDYELKAINKAIKESSENKRNRNKLIVLISQSILFLVYVYIIYAIYQNVLDSKLSCSLSVASSIFLFVSDKLLNNFVCTDINILISKEEKKHKKDLERVHNEKREIELG